MQANPSGSTATPALVNLAVILRVISEKDGDFYEKITSGSGARIHFDRFNKKFSSKKYIIRRKINNLIKWGFAPNRPRCKDCAEYMTPKRQRNKKDDNDDNGYLYVHCNNFERTN